MLDDDFLDLPDPDDEIVLLENPILDGSDLIEDEEAVDENDRETEQVVLLDTLRIDTHEVELL